MTLASRWLTFGQVLRSGTKTKLRPYQERLVSAVMDDVAAGVPEIVLAAAPGAGKTEMSFGIIRRALAQGLAARLLVLAHGTTVLRRQFADRARAELGERMVYEHVPGKGARRRLAATTAAVVVAIPQSLHRNDALPACDVVIVDEAHEFYSARMAKSVIARAGARSVVLLTGTPSKFIARGLPLRSIALHDVMKECPEAVCDPAIDLVSSEFLVEYGRYNRDGEIQKTFRFARKQTTATLDGLLAKMVEHLPRRRGQRASGWHEAISRIGKTIVACRSLALANQVAEYFRKRGVNAGLSTHENDLGSAEIERFKADDDMTLLIVVRRGVLGFNFPELMNLVDMTGTINIDRIFQMFARVVRPHPTRPKARKLFVKMTPKGKMEGYTKDVVSAALQLGRKETFESFNGGNLDCVVIPRWRGDGETGGGAPKDGGGRAAGPRKLRPLARCFRASDFFETVESMDEEFSPYAKTTLGRSRDLLLTRQPQRELVCSFAGCGRAARSRGFCKSHYRQWKKHGRLAEIVIHHFPTSCTFEGCDRRHAAHGLCDAHLGQKRKGRSLRPIQEAPRSTRGPVQAAEEKRIISLRRSGMSFSQIAFETGRSFQTVFKRIVMAEAAGTIHRVRHFQEKAAPGEIRHCSFEGCGKDAKSAGLCVGHYQQRRMGQELRELRTKRPRGSPARNCVFPGCSRTSERRGMCSAHRRQDVLGQELRPIRPMRTFARAADARADRA